MVYIGFLVTALFFLYRSKLRYIEFGHIGAKQRTFVNEEEEVSSASNVKEIKEEIVVAIEGNSA